MRGFYPRRPDPTPEEIAAGCAEIQAGWTEKEFAKRAGYREDSPYERPVVSTRSPKGKRVRGILRTLHI